ncbi:MAG: FAD/NAD(P)-binding oxidoreductase, partial [Parvularculaceae bacterium]
QKVARFERKKGDKTEIIDREFDMLHVCPPQTAPDFISASPLTNGAGWVDVDQHTLVHNKYPNIFGLGDACSTPNAKTAAAARKQAPIVAVNLLQHMAGKGHRAMYDGYGSCPLTVERGKIILAEFGYGGVLLPSFPSWLIDGTKPTSLAWFLKEKLLPPIYWKGMLKGKEWLVKPKLVKQST